MLLAQITPWRVVHEQVGDLILHAKLQHANDVGVDQVAEIPRFGEKAVLSVHVQGRVQDFHGRLRVEVQVLAQVDIGEHARAKQATDMIIPEMLTHTLRHCHCSYLSEGLQPYCLRNGRTTKGEADLLSELNGSTPFHGKTYQVQKTIVNVEYRE